MTDVPILTADDFPDVFQALHGLPPFPWQARLARQVVETGRWPAALALPTGSGKTAALDIALFHLAAEAGRGAERRAPVRIAFVVDRRLIVDAAFERAETIRAALARADESGCDALTRMAAALRRLAGENGPALVVQALRGGLPREGDWARTPAQPTILCSTVDQVGSRLLFRGYGVSDSMKPVHAGLLGSDCLLLLDEAHLAAPFAQTLDWVARYRSPPWCDRDPAPWQVVTLTATPRGSADSAPPFGLTDDDRTTETLARRLDAPKPAALRLLTTPAHGPDHAAALATAATKVLDRHRPRTLAVVVNRVALARAVFERVRAAHGDSGETDGEPPRATVILLTGRVRERDREALLSRHRDRLLSGATDDPDAPPLIVVATQTIEAGADFDLDALVTQIAPLDALRQRFGRLNRTGRPIPAPAVIVAAKAEVGKRADDPVYGDRLRATWDWLAAVAAKPARRKDEPVVDVGLSAMASLLDGVDTAPLCSIAPDAPILRPADVTLLTWTAPVPAVDPAIPLFLHGPDSGPADVQIVWRADLTPDSLSEARAILSLVPPHAGETLAVPLWAARRWLRRQADAAEAADVEGIRTPDEDRDRGGGRPAFRWAGAESDRTGLIHPNQIRPGDILVVPAAYGGGDAFGWAPDSDAPVEDVGDAQPPHRRAVRRLHPALFAEEPERWAGLAPLVRESDDLDPADRLAGLAAHDIDLGPDADLVLRIEGYDGAVLRARRRPRTAAAAVTEDDASGSLTGDGIPLDRHGADVAAMARAFAAAAGLAPDRAADVALAARLHDEGKRDDRFQCWLRGGDRLAALLDDGRPLAKSSRPMAPAVARRAHAAAGLPPGWRHEAQSVVRALDDPRLAGARDPALVLWLIGTHHGHGRPLFPHADPREDAHRRGPHCLDFAYDGRDWPQLFEALKQRYGPWELARMEAIVRLADHRASEAEETPP
ncbi:type I-G CRISPR-associated helicase/endonuclease Cas3g [Roseospira goensis]|uniref:CRISPR-associated endonuclease/helicase Cas3 n=1 Tax=Roseospira goensis TaxID=391922 RepID=A0A7W6RZU7_9PROT|nr:type I-U CRISPR-associated helicase/endonuclease Cas3 [Roseospira goensis]MBB4286132.1 CRISPR-associated endonuclease/helicase Cas3 [Roseospira goensis]